MRARLLVLTAVVVPPVLAALAAHGCSNEPPFESACLWMADPDNCYREFREDMLATANPMSPDNPFGDCRPVGSLSKPTQANQDPANPAGQENGSFATRAMLDTCTLDQGGQVKLDPPLDLTMWPPDPLADAITYKITLSSPDGNVCGMATYTSPHGFTITINPPPGADAGTDGGADAAPNTMTTDLTDQDAAIGATRMPYGTFSSVIPPGRDAFDVTCPNGDTHHFNLNEVLGLPGASAGACPGFADFLPSASFQVYPGGVDTPGAISFAIVYPPTKGTYPTDASAAPVPNDTVVYFNCTIPSAFEQCVDTVKDGAETDVDCGGPQVGSTTQPCGQCPARCVVGQQCLCDDDCDQSAAPQLCAVVAGGMRQCTAPDAGVIGHSACSWKPNPNVACDQDAGIQDAGPG
jgi:hypothetical protein